MVLKKINPIHIFLLISLLGFFIRIILLSVVPPSLTNDEVNIIINAQSILKTGKNIPGVATGIFGMPQGDLGGGIHSEISSLLIVPFLAVFGFKWPLVKLPFIFASLGTVVLVYLLTRNLINHKLALIAAVLSAINPWSIHFGRAAYESIFSCFFYLLAIYLVVSKEKWKILWSLPFFILGFLSYFSAKTLLLPLTLLSILTVKLLKPKAPLKPILTLNLIVIIFFLLYISVLRNLPAGVRFQELGSQNLSQTVDRNRTESTNFPFIEIFENKVIEDLKLRTKASLGAFSPNFLFLDGIPESTPALSIPHHAPLYFIELPLTLLGLIFLARKYPKILVILLGIIVTTLIPNFLNLQGTTYMIRTVYLFPLLIIFSATGIYFLLTELVISNPLKSIFSIFLLIIYLFSFGNFAYHYFAKTPIVSNEGWFFHQRVIAKYITSAKDKFDSNIIVYTPDSKHAFFRYLFFSGNYEDDKNISDINTDLASKKYELENVVFVNDCPTDKVIEDKPDSIHIISARMCAGFAGNSIASLKDAGHIYIIINDRLCGSFVKRRYPLIKDFKYLNVEKLEDSEFCENLINNTNLLSI